MTQKKKYYVNVQSREISQVPYGNNDQFTIYATGDEVKMLRMIMNKVYDADRSAYWRAHVPIVPYHRDKSNDIYDDGLTEAFQMLHDLGDSKTKEHIREMGVLSDRPM